MKKSLIYFILFSGVFVTLTFLSYLLVQQDLRMSANDPQIQLAEDDARALSLGAVPASVVSRGKSINISESLAPFVIVYDNKGLALESEAKLHNSIPIPPKGVFDYTRTNGEDRITWQPEDGVRMATVITRWQSGNSSGFVLAGRSIREVENRAQNLLRITLVVTLWLVGLSLILAIVLPK